MAVAGDLQGAAGDRGLQLRATGALLLAGARYWSSVAPQVRVQLDRCTRRARAIEDRELRELALEKLHHERFNAEAAAMLATLAPRAHRAQAVKAIVALAVLFDYLDGLTERPLKDPLCEGEQLYEPFTHAIGCAPESVLDDRHSDRGSVLADTDLPPGPRSPSADHRTEANEADYEQELSKTVRAAVARLPANDAILAIARGVAARSAQTQVRMHAAAHTGTAQLEGWAASQAPNGSLEWRELLAGTASSVLVLHALIAAAADPRTTRAEAEDIEAAYLATCVLVTLLDGLVDRTRDVQRGELSYAQLYESPELLAQTLMDAAGQASRKARALRHGVHHTMTLASAVAYYASTPDARGDRARPVLAQLLGELGPLTAAPLLLMRTWRAAKRTRGRLRGDPSHDGLDIGILTS